MSWAEMNYVFRLKKETGIVGNVRFVLLCLAKRIPKARYESLPTSQGLLARMTGLDPKSVRTCLKKLVELREIAEGQRGRGPGNFKTYLMLKIQGPLFMAGEDLKEGAPPGVLAPPKAGDAPAFPVAKRAFRPAAVRTGSSEEISTQDPSTTPTPAVGTKRVAAAIYDDALTFLQWLQATYPTVNGGAQITVDYEADGPRIEQLLKGGVVGNLRQPARTLEQLQAMAVVMWTVTVAEDRWLSLAPHRGITLLCARADRFDRIVARRAQAARTHDEDAAAVLPMDADDRDPVATPNAWTRVLDHLADTMGRASFRMWFTPCLLLEASAERLIIGVPNDLFCEWLPKHYSVVLGEATAAAGVSQTIEWRVSTAAHARQQQVTQEAVG